MTEKSSASKKATAKPPAAKPATKPRARRTTASPPPEPARADIERRAHEISQSGHGGTPEENWLQAERELRGEQG
jgi:hypothetical protein